MQKLLLADAPSVLRKSVEKQLKSEFLIQTCDDGTKVLDLIRSFQPDIMLLELQLTGIDGLSVLRTIRSAGFSTKVIVLTALSTDYICAELTRLQVSYIFPRPCLLGSVISCIRDVSVIAEHSLHGWCVENETDRLLLDLGFNMGPVRYCYVHAAVLYKYDDPDGFMTKCLYPDLAKRFGNTSTGIEKAIRDSIKAAWNTGCPQIWKLYFHPDRNGICACPSNEQFLARIANVLHQKTRIKKPYQKQQSIAKS